MRSNNEPDAADVIDEPCFEPEPQDDPHSDLAQLVCAPKGVLVVSSDQGNWMIPSSKVLWLTPGVTHQIRHLGDGDIHRAYVRPESGSRLPQRSCVLAASPLFLEIIETVSLTPTRVIPYRLSLLLTELLFEEVVEPSELPFHLPSPRDPRLVRICSYIQEHRDEMKTLHQWAKEMECDERTLHRLFVQELGMGFAQWRNQAKLLAALEWLAEGRQILSIALDLGYQTQSAFTAMFRRNLGVAPSALYRRPSEEDSRGG